MFLQVFSLLNFIFKVILLLVPALLGVAFITLLERKVLGLTGLRLGPNKTSFMGILQPISDAVKLSNKQVNMLSNSSYIFYYISAGFMFFSALMIWTSLFTFPSLINWKLSILLVLLCLAFNSLNSILAGWSTFSKYSLIGTVRTVSQLISYEAVLYVIFFFVIFCFMNFNLYEFSSKQDVSVSLLAPFIFMIWIPTMLAELNRTPYDFSEGESELVSGFNTEFGSSSFTLIFLAEYGNILFLSILTSFLFFLPYFSYFFVNVFLFVIWIRSVLPRYRFDKLMILAWKIFIPLSTLMLLSYLSWSF